MSDAISTVQLFNDLSERLGLKWVTAAKAPARSIDQLASHELRPSIAGFLNLIHPNDVQVLGVEEVRYLDSLDSRKRWETVAEIIGEKPAALVVCDNLMPPDDLVEAARESGTPVWSTENSGVELVSHIQHFVSRALAQSTTVHGVFMEVFSIGVLITGDSGSGKSELALELITRGHRLIADDAPLVTIIAPDVIDGSCPDLLQDCLEVRGLGVLNVRAMFGDSAVKQNKYLRLIIHLDLSFQNGKRVDLDRLHGDQHFRDILGVQIPVITIPVAPGRNMAVIVEAAVRNHNLKMNGFDAASEFLQRHEDYLKMAET